MPSANVALALSARTRTSRFLFLSALLAFVCGTATLCCTSSVSAAEKSNDPNIIYILADDKNQVFADGSYMPLNQSIYPRNTACHDSVQFRSSQANPVGLTTVYYIK